MWPHPITFVMFFQLEASPQASPHPKGEHYTRKPVYQIKLNWNPLTPFLDNFQKVIKSDINTY